MFRSDIKKAREVIEKTLITDEEQSIQELKNEIAKVNSAIARLNQEKEPQEKELLEASISNEDEEQNITFINPKETIKQAAHATLKQAAHATLIDEKEKLNKIIKRLNDQLTGLQCQMPITANDDYHTAKNYLLGLPDLAKNKYLESYIKDTLNNLKKFEAKQANLSELTPSIVILNKAIDDPTVDNIKALKEESLKVQGKPSVLWQGLGIALMGCGVLLTLCGIVGMLVSFGAISTGILAVPGIMGKVTSGLAITGGAMLTLYGYSIFKEASKPTGLSSDMLNIAEKLSPPKMSPAH